MDNLRKFANEAEFSAATLNYPAVSWIESDDTVHYNLSGSTPPQYRTISSSTYCSGTHGVDKYVDVYSQVSYDGGSTWETTATTPTLIEQNSADCGFATRTVSGTPYCTGSDLYVVTSAQTSYDGGMTWTTTSTAETLVESGSSQCQSPTPTFEWVTANNSFNTSTPVYEITANDEYYAGSISQVDLHTSGGTDYYFQVEYDYEQMSSIYRLYDSNWNEIGSGSGMYCDLYSIIGEPVYLTSIPEYEECTDSECVEYCEDEETGEEYCCNEECISYDYHYPFNVKVPQ